MKKSIFVSIAFLAIVFLVSSSLCAVALLKGDTLFMQAQVCEKDAEYFKALETEMIKKSRMLGRTDDKIHHQNISDNILFMRAA